jgi:hypothetical protein
MRSFRRSNETRRTIEEGRASGSAAAMRNFRRGVSARVMATAALALPALGASLAGPAQATPLPSISTGAAREVSYSSAVLTGSVNPKGSATSYYFQYGPTKAYGGQSAIAGAGAGSRRVSVRLSVSGLQPLTVYHYRLVAVNGAGATLGGERTFLTTKVPLSLQILAEPNPILYGGNVTVEGTLSGTENADREVVLQANQFPFTTGFKDIGNPELTSANGSFSFAVLGLALVTQFRVITTTSPPVTSTVAVENVAVQVTSHVRRARRRHFARIYGTVTPAENGMEVGILRIAHGRGVLVGGTILTHLNAGSSAFSRVVPVRPGVYRVLVRVTDGSQVSNYGQPLLIR